MCNPRNREVISLAWFLTYQLILVYLWVVYILTSTYDIEIVYCPRKLTEEFLLFTHIITQMSKTVTKRKSKQKVIDPKFGVSEWDPAELDVTQTRHGTYESRPPPRGGTWRDQIREEAYKLRQRQREADSPEFISPHSTTDTMDTDEAQEINKQIIERMEKEPEGAEYLNVIGEEKYENVGVA